MSEQNKTGTKTIDELIKDGDLNKLKEIKVRLMEHPHWENGAELIRKINNALKSAQ